MLYHLKTSWHCVSYAMLQNFPIIQYSFWQFFFIHIAILLKSIAEVANYVQNYFQECEKYQSHQIVDYV